MQSLPHRAEHKKRSKACPYVTRPGQCDIADDAPAAAHAHAHAHATSSKATAAATAPAATREEYVACQWHFVPNIGDHVVPCLFSPRVAFFAADVLGMYWGLV